MIYNIRQTGANNLLFNYEVNSDTPIFSCVFTNPWTMEEKTATIIPEGDDGEWIINIIGVVEAYEDLGAGEIYFSHTGTWGLDVFESGSLVKSMNVQVTW